MLRPYNIEDRQTSTDRDAVVGAQHLRQVIAGSAVNEPA